MGGHSTPLKQRGCGRRKRSIENVGAVDRAKKIGRKRITFRTINPHKKKYPRAHLKRANSCGDESFFGTVKKKHRTKKTPTQKTRNNPRLPYSKKKTTTGRQLAFQSSQQNPTKLGRGFFCGPRREPVVLDPGIIVFLARVSLPHKRSLWKRPTVKGNPIRKTRSWKKTNAAVSRDATTIKRPEE